MKVELGPEVAQIVEQAVARGGFESPEQVVAEALMLLHEQAETLRAVVAAAEESATAGRVTDVDAAFWARIRSRYQ